MKGVCLMKSIKAWIHKLVLYHRWKVVGRHVDLEGMWKDPNGFFADYYFEAQGESLLYRIKDHFERQKEDQRYREWLKNPENRKRVEQLRK